MIAKKEAAWLLVRLIGIAFGFAAFWHVCAAAFSVYVMAGPFEDSGHVYVYARQNAVLEVLMAGGYGILCLYFIRRGTLVHRILMREEH